MDFYLVMVSGTRPFVSCITSVTCSKMVEAILSFFFILFTGYEIFKNIQEKFKISFMLIIQICMLLSLICKYLLYLVNLIHSIWDYLTLLILEVLFANLFFLTIFYYVGYNVLTMRLTRILLHSLFALFSLF